MYNNNHSLPCLSHNPSSPSNWPRDFDIRAEVAEQQELLPTDSPQEEAAHD